MSAAGILNGKLYLELLLVGFILLSMMLVNNIFLYKQKIKDLVSFMLIFAIAMSTSEIIWMIIEGNPSMKVLCYLSSTFYTITFIIFAALLDIYMLGRLGIKLSKVWQIILYGVPVAAFIVFCISAQWTKLVFWVDENGFVQDGSLISTLYIPLLLAYFLVPVFIALFFATIGKSKKPAGGEIPFSLFVFGIMVPAFYFFQVFLIGDSDTSYVTLSLPVSLALIYLVTNVSTHTVLDTRAHIEAVETDLRIASKIQADALPDVAPEFVKHLDLNLRGSMNTAKEVGGDFYDYFPIDDNRICFLIADVSGKGTPAALFMMTAKTMINAYAMNKDNTADIFTEVNARLCENNDEGMFATAWIGILDIRTMKLQYTNAGHNYPVIKRRGQPAEEIKELHGLFLAGMEFTKYKQDEIQLEPGDRILLYTDGVTEAHNQAKELYGMERLLEMVERTKDLSNEEVLDQILDDINEYATGVPQFDDITMIAMSIKDKADKDNLDE